jgi:hypothetical protein
MTLEPKRKLNAYIRPRTTLSPAFPIRQFQQKHPPQHQQLQPHQNQLIANVSRIKRSEYRPTIATNEYRYQGDDQFQHYFPYCESPSISSSATSKRARPIEQTVRPKAQQQICCEPFLRWASQPKRNGRPPHSKECTHRSIQTANV